MIAQRVKNVHQGGLWEFPGGKVENGETVEQACIREVREELGIEIKYSRPLIKILHHYPDKNVLLDTLLCTDFSGKEYLSDTVLQSDEINQYGLEGQNVKWINLAQFNDYQFPAANKSIINSLLLPEKYLISPDCSAFEVKQFIQQFTENCRHYAIIQLRISSLKASEFKVLFNKCCFIAHKHGVKLLLNSSLLYFIDDDTYFEYAGLHLTGSHLFDDNFINNYRSRFPDKMISASCHQAGDINQANNKKIDFIVLSPVQKTRSHPQQDPLGWKNFEFLCEMAQMPCFALGGMSIDDIHDAWRYGAQGIAGISSFWETGF